MTELLVVTLVLFTNFRIPFPPFLQLLIFQFHLYCNCFKRTQLVVTESAGQFSAHPLEQTFSIVLGKKLGFLQIHLIRH